MTRAWILMTAMPPTKGHRALIEFGASLASEVNVIVATQPGEPMANERWRAVWGAGKHINFNTVHVYHMHRELPQDPSTEGFWDLWQDIMLHPSNYMRIFTYGVQPGDLIVSSEPYGKTLADLTNAVFMPYDPNRELLWTKGTEIRDKPLVNFEQIMPEFQHYMRTNVVVFGAESTGKTTLSKELAKMINGHWFFEWARPYLETVGPEITKESMTAIHYGQAATQLHSYNFYDKPYAVYDTDLFSTVGYWEQPHWEAELGPVPKDLVHDAIGGKADLYLITLSNIPFEEDVIRYGGDRRESPDEFWINVAEKYDLNYAVLEKPDRYWRLSQAAMLAKKVALEKTAKIKYDRGGF